MKPFPRKTQAPWARALLLTAMIAAAYANSFHGAFLFDDIYRIVENPRIRQLWPIGPLLANDRPIVEVSLALNYAIGGLAVGGYHLFNGAIHSLAALTLFGVVRRTVRSVRGKPDEWTAWVIAAIWAAHPLQTQSVIYLIQRSESLMGLFFLLTLYCAIRRRGEQQGHLWSVGAVACCALGMLSKAVMVTAPVIVLLHDFIFWPDGTRRKKLTLFAWLAGTWCLLWISGVARTVLDPASPNANVGFSFEGVRPLTYALTQAGVLVRYVRLSFVPTGLCLDYEWPFVTGVASALPALIPVTALVVAAVVGVIHRKWWGFALAWFFVILAPTSSIIPIKDAIFEHRMYLSLAGVVAVIVVFMQGLVWGACLRTGIGEGRRTAVQTIVAVAAIGALGFGTYQRNQVYESDVRMWSDVIAKRPENARARVALGNALLARDRTEEAVAAYRQAVGLRADFADAHAALGMGLARSGKTSEAIAEYETAIRLEPTHSKAHFNLANALSREGRLDEAIAAYRRSIELRPDFADAHCNLGNALSRHGRFDEAVEEHHEALRIDPKMAKAHNNLGDVHRQRGRMKEAIECFARAVEIDPHYANAHANLAAAYLDTGKKDLAARHARRALELDPKHPTAREILRDASR